MEERDKTAYKLESAEVKLIKLANKAPPEGHSEGRLGQQETDESPLDAESGSIAKRWIRIRSDPPTEPARSA